MAPALLCAKNAPHTHTHTPPPHLVLLFLGRARYMHGVRVSHTNTHTPVLSAVLCIMSDIYTHTHPNQVPPTTDLGLCIFKRNNVSHSLITRCKCFSTYSRNQMNLSPLFGSCFVSDPPADSPRSCWGSVWMPWAVVVFRFAEVTVHACEQTHDMLLLYFLHSFPIIACDAVSHPFATKFCIHISFRLVLSLHCCHSFFFFFVILITANLWRVAFSPFLPPPVFPFALSVSLPIYYFFCFNRKLKWKLSFSSHGIQTIDGYSIL